MGFLSVIRQRVNRDDGKLFQVGNRPVGWVESIALLLFIASMLLWQIHAKIGLSWIWAAAAGALGLLLAVLGGAAEDDESDE
jgi:hypothetical protein